MITLGALFGETGKILSESFARLLHGFAGAKDGEGVVGRNGGGRGT